jgi:hypothetical protein
MTPMFEARLVLHLGRLASAYFHVGALHPDTLGDEMLIESDVTDPHFIAVCRNTDGYQMLRILPIESCR